MSELTKKTITDCTLALCEQKPLSKITVRDIVDNCGITRNTFYYYFHDIFDVLNTMIEEKYREVAATRKGDPEGAIFDFFEFCVQYKKVWINLYKTVGRDEMSRYVMKNMRVLILEAMSEVPGYDKVSQHDVNLVLSFYEEGIFGIVLRWITSDNSKKSPQEFKVDIDRIRKLFAGQFKLIIENSLQKE